MAATTIEVRTARPTDYEAKLQKKVRTSGCAQGTVFGDLMDEIDRIAIGIAGGVVCYFAVSMKPKFGYDDALDVVGVHMVGGTLGALLTGVFATELVNSNIRTLTLGLPGGRDGAGHVATPGSCSRRRSPTFQSSSSRIWLSPLCSRCRRTARPGEKRWL